MNQAEAKPRWYNALFLAVIMPFIVVIAIYPVRNWFTTTDIVMLQLLWVTLGAVRSNRRLAILTTLVSVACTDWFFVAPNFIRLLITLDAEFDGIAKPIPIEPDCPGAIIAVLIPITIPFKSKRGPPEFPWFIDASV